MKVRHSFRKMYLGQVRKTAYVVNKDGPIRVLSPGGLVLTGPVTTYPINTYFANKGYVILKLSSYSSGPYYKSKVGYHRPKGLAVNANAIQGVGVTVRVLRKRSFAFNGHRAERVY